jgi:hypothetical protein
VRVPVWMFTLLSRLVCALYLWDGQGVDAEGGVVEGDGEGGGAQLQVVRTHTQGVLKSEMHVADVCCMYDSHTP